MLSTRMRRALSMKVSRPLQHAKKVEGVTITVSSQQDATDKAADDTNVNPWSHFTAFSSMDDYVDVTLIKYNNKEDDDSDKKP